MENFEIIKEALQRFGINDNMILSDTLNISGRFMPENEIPEKIKRIKITVEFEAQIIEK